MVELTAQPITTKILIAIMVINIAFNYFWRDQLFKLGMNLIYRFQKLQNVVFNGFFQLITTLIDPLVVLLTTLTLIIIVKKKYNAFVTVTFILLNTYLTGVLKAFYADPRPFWANHNIKSIGLYCPQEYGNPSGHSWFSVVISFALIIEYWGLGKRLEYLYACIGIMIFVPMSRMYLGAHSLNQVLQGLTLGLIMVFFYKFSGLKQQIESFLKNFNSEPKLKWKKIIIVMHICYIFSYLINQQKYNPYFIHIQQIWVTNIKQKCNKDVDANHLNFMMLMINSLIVNMATGLALGFQQLIKSQQGRLYLSGNWLINQQRYSKLVGNLLYYVIELTHWLAGGLPVVLMVYLFGNRHSVLFIFGNIGAFFAGYLYTAKAFKTLFKYKVIRQETP